MTTNRLPREVRDDWEQFWKPLVTTRGRISVNKLARELFDYGALMQRAGIIIDYATGGQVSKPNTDPDTVKRLIDQHVMELIESEIEDRKPRRKRRKTK